MTERPSARETKREFVMTEHVYTTNLPHSMLLAGIPALFLAGISAFIGYLVGGGSIALTDPRAFGGIAFMGALFGVAVVRILWAQDLNHARKIDAIQSRTENSLRATIAELRSKEGL